MPKIMAQKGEAYHLSSEVILKGTVGISIIDFVSRRYGSILGRASLKMMD